MKFSPLFCCFIFLIPKFLPQYGTRVSCPLDQFIHQKERQSFTPTQNKFEKNNCFYLSTEPQ